MQRLSGKVAFITGGGTGIGRACALLFAREGAALAIAGRRKAPLESAVREIEAAGGKAAAFTCDVVDHKSVESALASAAKHFGALHIVVNNAGAVVVAAADETSDEDWDTVVATNLTGTFKVSRAAYCAAKAGVTGLTKAMALDHAHENIRVNCVCPSLVETELGLKSIREAPDPEVERKRRTEGIPLGRLGLPEDVAQMALYLASDESAWVTGAALPLDGGLTAY